jgi:hypothetical protein
MLLEALYINKFHSNLLTKSWTYAIIFSHVEHLGVLQFSRLPGYRVRNLLG